MGLFRKNKEDFQRPISSTDRIINRFESAQTPQEARALFLKCPLWLQKLIKYFIILCLFGVVFNIINAWFFLPDIDAHFKTSKPIPKNDETEISDPWAMDLYKLMESGTLNDSTLQLLNEKYGDTCSVCP